MIFQIDSPDRENYNGLSRFEMGKITVGAILYNDRSLEVTLKLQSVILDDIRSNSNLAIKRYVPYI